MGDKCDDDEDDENIIALLIISCNFVTIYFSYR
jgi:hypothetical protein